MKGESSWCNCMNRSCSLSKILYCLCTPSAQLHYAMFLIQKAIWFWDALVIWILLSKIFIYVNALGSNRPILRSNGIILLIWLHDIFWSFITVLFISNWYWIIIIKMLWQMYWIGCIISKLQSHIILLSRLFLANFKLDFLHRNTNLSIAQLR